MSPARTPPPAHALRRLPWPLVPKIACVALLLGSFASVEVLTRALPRATAEDWRRLVEAVGTLFVTLIVPASFGTVAFSLLLLWPQRRTFFRQRWAQLKVGLLVLTLPALHLAARGVFTGLRGEVGAGHLDAATASLATFRLLVEATVVVLLVAIGLARAKPPWGRGSG